MQKLTRSELAELLAHEIPAISPQQRDEMAIPSYLHRNPLIRWLFWRRYEVIAGIVRQRNAGTALEFGCGVGAFLPELADCCDRVYAIDLFPEYARLLNAKKNLGVEFPGDIDEVADASLDVIVAADVLEHVDDLESLLVRFGEKLNDRGALIISGPTENVAYRIGRFLAGFSGKADYHHRNIDDITAVAMAAGFRLLQTAKLPFPAMPTLFKICTFEKGERASIIR